MAVHEYRQPDAACLTPVLTGSADAELADLVWELDVSLDPRHLRPSELLALLNSTPLGTITDRKQVYRHRERAGLRIGDTQTVDLVRYVAWLVTERHRPRPSPIPGALTGYELEKERHRARAAELSRTGRDISADGWVHPPLNPERKERARRDLLFFVDQYLPDAFTIGGTHLPWSADHLKVIAKIQRAVLEGGLFAIAMPRGSGKTSLCEAGCLWALLFGHREFVALIGADEGLAENCLKSIAVELESNDLIEQDLSEVVGPIRALEGIHQRASGQLYAGERTRIGWTAREIALPTLPALDFLDNKPPPSNGAVVCVAGITGRINGMKHKRPDGVAIRPSLVLIDDPQTPESAFSPSQCAARERIVNGAILGLAGPGRRIAGLMTITVMRPDDLADRMLDRERNPQWQGERTKMVYAWPHNDKLWSAYAELRRRAQRELEGQTFEITRRCNDFYLLHRDEMDVGGRVAWPEHVTEGDISAIQSAWNLRIDRKESAFWSEYQNEPLTEQASEEEQLTTDGILTKLNGHKRGEVPLDATHLTMFVDSHDKALYWLIVAWADDFTGYILDYGTEPDQKTTYFSLREIRYTLSVAAPRAGLEGAVYAGLERLAERLLGREWRRADGAMLRVERCLADANYGDLSNVVYQFCRQSKHAGVLMPSHGRGVGAKSLPFGDRTPKRGERVGVNWRIPVVVGKRQVRHIVYETNFWKSFVRARLLVPMGDPGCLSIFGRRADAHQLLAEHLTSERCTPTEGRDRSLTEWLDPPPGRDNHWWDCLVGCAVGANMQGCELGIVGKPAHMRKRPTVAEFFAGRKR